MRRVVIAARYVLVSASTLVIAMVVWSATILGLAFNAALPVGHGCQLWQLSGEAGWSLVVPLGDTGLVEQGLGYPVARLAKLEDGFVVQLRDGTIVLSSRDGGTWSRTEASPGDVLPSGLNFRTPDAIRRRFVVTRYWWGLVIEAILLAAGIAQGLRWAGKGGGQPASPT